MDLRLTPKTLLASLPMFNQDWVKLIRAQQTPSQKGHFSQKEHMSFMPHPFSQVVCLL
jgi:hypothetical protein